MELELYDLIELGSAKHFAAAVRQAKPTQTIDLRINSAGGVAFEGVAMFNALKNHQGDVHVHVDGLAASAATLPMMAGNTITMASNAQLMIHNSRTPFLGMLTAREARRLHSQLGRTDKQAAGIYAERTGKEADDLRAMMADETWMDAEEAMQHGFVTEISEPSTVALNCSPEVSREWFTRPDRFESIAESRFVPIDEDNAREQLQRILSCPS